MRYRQGACSHKCELHSCDAVAFKMHVQYLWNEVQMLAGSSGTVYSSKQSMVLRGNSWTMSEMFSSSMLLTSACTPQCGHSRDTESTLPVGSCTPGMEGSSAKSAFGKKSLLGWLLALKFSCWWNRTQTVQAASGKCLWSPPERELHRLG